MPGKQAHPWRSRVGWAAACGGLAMALAAMYLGLYRARGFKLPVGFDASWYVWRAGYVAGQGLGALGTAARPGHEVLSAILGAVTGRTQLELAVVLPSVLAGVFALALGAVLWECLAGDEQGRRWLAAVILGGVLLGATRLVDENAAALLFLVVVVSASVPLVEHAVADHGGGGRGPPTAVERRWRRTAFVSAVLLILAAGLAHWLFLGVFGLMLAGAVVVLGRGSLRARRAGTPLLSTEAGSLALTGAAAAGVMALMVGAVLRAPVDTIEIREDPGRFLPKLRTDAARLWVWLLAPVAALGTTALAMPVIAGRRAERVGRRPLAFDSEGEPDEPDDGSVVVPLELDPVGRSRSPGAMSRRRAVALTLVMSWAVVAIAGIVYGAVTRNLPPHRFLELLVVVPGVVALAEVAVLAARWMGARAGTIGAWAATIMVAVALAVPGAIAWYRSDGPKVWIDPAGLQQATTAQGYIRSLPAGSAFIVVVSRFGPAGTLSVPLKERTIRIPLPADRQVDLRLFVGEPADALAGRRTLAPGAATNRATLPYWLGVRPVLAAPTPILILRAFAPSQFDQATGSLGARVIGPGVALLRGVPPAAPLVPAPVPVAFTGMRNAMVWAGVLLLVLFFAGLGWTSLMLGQGAEPAALFGLAPAVGAAALILVGTVLSRVGLALGDRIGVAAVAVVAGFGWFAAWLRRG